MDVNFVDCQHLNIFLDVNFLDFGYFIVNSVGMLIFFLWFLHFGLKFKGLWEPEYKIKPK
jgi:hypothetical protein